MSKSFIATLLLGIAALLVFVLVLPAYDELDAAKRAVREREQLLADTKAAQSNFARQSESYRANETSLARALKAVPRRGDLDYVTSSMHEATQSTGTRLTQLTVGTSHGDETNAYQRVDIQVQVEGRYQELVEFLRALENSIRIYDVSSVSLTSDSSGVLKAHFTITAYFFP